MINSVKLVLLFVFLGALVVNTSAQRFEGGILAGLNASQVEGDHVEGYNKPGVLAGGFVQTDISRSTFIGMELKYSQKGSRKNPNPEKNDQTKYIMRLGYFDLPIYVGFRTSDKFSLLGGFSAGYQMHAKEYDNYDEIPEIEQRPFNTMDYQIFLGLRYKLNERISVDLRGAYSFLPIRDLPGDAPNYIWDDQYNNLLSTAIYYRLDY